MYRVRQKRFRQLIDSLGEYGLGQVSSGAKVSVSLLQKLYAGTYRSSVGENQRERLSRYFKVSESEIFELVGASEKKRTA